MVSVIHPGEIDSLPEQIPVTEAGYHGRLAPSPALDTGYINPDVWRSPGVHSRFEPHEYDHRLYRFIRRNQYGTKHWDDIDVTDVPLSPSRGSGERVAHPVFATQPFVNREHLRRYLDDPKSKTHYAATTTDPAWAERYAFSHTPGFIVHRNRLIVADGHHRVAAALLRGDQTIRAKVWHADDRGLPDPLKDGWERA